MHALEKDGLAVASCAKVQNKLRLLAGGAVSRCAPHIPCADAMQCMSGAQERSKLQLLAAGAELVDPELEVMWNWNIHVRKHAVRANVEVRPVACC